MNCIVIALTERQAHGEVKGLELIHLISKLISDNYDIKIKDIKLIDSHFGTDIFLAQADSGKYIVKTLPLHCGANMENEGYITDYLYNNDVSVARLLKTSGGAYHVKTDELQFHVQEFIEGETLKVNTAPDGFLEKSARTLGKIHSVLKDYRELEINFNKDFFSGANVSGSAKHYSDQLIEALDKKDAALISELETRLKHLERISAFDIDTDKLTYSNSHGDFHIGQIIACDNDTTVIDWTSACRLPVCLEIMMSYVTADPECGCGRIDGGRLKRYINHYSEHFTLNAYDLKIMPYLFYYQQIMCHYPPPYSNVADAYKPICGLINNFTGWLYENVETLSDELAPVCYQ